MYLIRGPASRAGRGLLGVTPPLSKEGGSDGQGVGVGVYLAAGGNVSILDSSIAGNYASTSDDDVFGSFGP
jgi:hypothetical protein